MKLKRGSKGKEVVDLQTRLKSLGFSLGLEDIDGFFGIKTEEAVKSFQQKEVWQLQVLLIQLHGWKLLKQDTL